MKNLIKNTVKNWWLLSISGALFLLLGLWVSTTPATSFLALIFLFQLSFLFSGLFEIMYALSNKSVLDNWGWILGGGVLNVLFALILATHPSLSATVFPIYVGFILLFRSMIGISWAVDMKRWNVHGWRWTMFTAFLGIIFSSVIIFNPLFGGIAIVYYTAITLMLWGVVLILLSLGMKKLNSELQYWFLKKSQTFTSDGTDEMQKIIGI